MNNYKRLNIGELNDVITVPEAASFFGVSIRTINNWLKDDEIKSFKIGQTRLILKQNILETIGLLDIKEQEQEIEVAEENDEIPSRFLEISETPITRCVPVPKGRGRTGYKAISMGA